MTESVDKIDLKTAQIYKDDDGIVHVKYKDEIEVDVEAVKKHIEAIIKLANGQEVCVLLDARNVNSQVTSEAREYASTNKEYENTRKAYAIVVNSLANKLVANFYIKFNKPAKPSRVFNNKKEAMDWLKEFLS